MDKEDKRFVSTAIVAGGIGLIINLLFWVTIIIVAAWAIKTYIL